jgi:hypothetical protein
MANQPLEKRAGRNIGIESLPVFLQAAGAPEVLIANVPEAPTLSTAVTLLEGVEGALRTPFTRGEEAGMIFNPEADIAVVGVYFEDELGNRMLIALNFAAADAATPLDLSVTGSDVNPFTPAKPLSLCDGEKLVVRATLQGGGE